MVVISPLQWRKRKSDRFVKKELTIKSLKITPLVRWKRKSKKQS